MEIYKDFLYICINKETNIKTKVIIMKREASVLELEADGRSAALTAIELKKLNKFVDRATTKKAAAKYLDISANALDGILSRGSSKPYVIDSIRKKLSEIA